MHDSDDWTMTTGDYQAAKDELERAIEKYYAVCKPGVYVSDWILIANQLTIASERRNETVISHLVRTGQAWPTTLGMMVAVHDRVRYSSGAD